MTFFSRRREAFTLIELLIVITIIGILAVALVPRITGGPAKARDAARKADLQQISTVLEFYADDNGGSYPDSSGACLSDISSDLESYLTSDISDPKEGQPGGPCDTGYAYLPLESDGSSTPNGYLLMATLETSTSTGDGIYSATGVSFDASASAAENLAAFDACGGSTDCSVDGAVYVVGR